jgi:ectoine hydroxylase-related dioxygenase (phytanoyl-CoA dioxygenase family)
MRAFLGSEFIMGSIAANRILPGGPGQEPHIDYPYWDYHSPESHPARINASFPLNAQATIMLDPFTEETGATAYVPGTQASCIIPVEATGSTTAANACSASRAIPWCSSARSGTAPCRTGRSRTARRS